MDEKCVWQGYGDTHDFVEDGRVIVDVFNGDLERANIIELGSAVVCSQDRQVDFLFADRLVSVEYVRRRYYTRDVVYLELKLFSVGHDEAVCDGSLKSKRLD